MRPSHAETLHCLLREAERERNRLPPMVAEITEGWRLSARVEALEAELATLRSVMEGTQRALEAQDRIQAHLVEDVEVLGQQLIAERARFKIEKYLRMAYTISSERRMSGETAEAAFERLSATRELELAGRIVMDNVGTLDEATCATIWSLSYPPQLAP